MKLSLIVLTRNEVNGCHDIIPNIPRHAVDEIIVMDGNSTDGTVEYVQSQGLTVVQQTAPGRGSAMREGVARATGDAVIFFSPDGNEDPADIARFRPLLEQGNDLVIASRMMNGAWNEEDASWLRLRKWANQAFTLAASLCWNRSGRYVTDTINGFRAIRKNALARLELDAKGYTIEFQMTQRCWRLGIPIAEFPTHEGARIGGESGAKAIPTGLAFLRCLWSERRWNGDAAQVARAHEPAPSRLWGPWARTWLPVVVLTVAGLVALGAQRGLLTPDEGFFLLIRNSWRAIFLALGAALTHGWAEASAALHTQLEGSFYVYFNARPLYVLFLVLPALLWGSWVSAILPSALAVGALVWAISRAPWSLAIRIWATVVTLSSPIVLVFGSSVLAQASAGTLLFFGVLVLTSPQEVKNRSPLLGGLLLGMAGLAHYSAFPLVVFACAAYGFFVLKPAQWIRKGPWLLAGVATPLLATEGATHLIRFVWDRVHPSAAFGTYIQDVIGIFFIVEKSETILTWSYYLRTLWHAEGVAWMLIALAAGVMTLFLWRRVPATVRVSLVVSLAGLALLSATPFKGVRALMLILPLLTWVIGWSLNEISRGIGRKGTVILLVVLAGLMGVTRIPRVMDLVTMPNVMERIPVHIAIQEGLAQPLAVLAVQEQWMARRGIAQEPTVSLDAWLAAPLPFAERPGVTVLESVEDFPEAAERMGSACTRDGGRMGNFPRRALSAYDWYTVPFGKPTDAKVVRYCVLSSSPR